MASHAGRAEFTTRREAEVDMFLHCFKNLEEILNPAPEYYIRRVSNDTSSQQSCFDDLSF